MTIYNILVSLLIFGFLIIVHELGHFLSARLAEVKVEEFAIGMGPKLFKKQGKETLYTVRAFPIGGFCKMLGEDQNDYSEGSFNSKSKFARGIILFFGSFMNLISTIVLLSIIFMIIGSATTTIDSVDIGYPAYGAGLRNGDKIIEINDQRVNSWESITNIISDTEQKSYDILIQRDKSQKKITVGSKYDEELKRYRIGITPTKSKNFFRAIQSGFNQTWIYTKLMFGFLGQLVTGNASSNDVMGPIGVISIVGETVQYGIVAILNLAAIISLNLAIFNLLPIPALDGSRILFIIIEAIKGSPVAPEKEGMVHFVGFVCLMALAIFVAYNDIIRLR